MSLQDQAAHTSCGVVGGVTLGLPFLETLRPAQGGGAQTAATPKRLAIFFNHNGVNMDEVVPDHGVRRADARRRSRARGSSRSPSYAPKILLPRGLHQVPRGFGRDPSGGDDHARGVGCKLTAAPLADTHRALRDRASRSIR